MSCAHCGTGPIGWLLPRRRCPRSWRDSASGSGWALHSGVLHVSLRYPIQYSASPCGIILRMCEKFRHTLIIILLVLPGPKPLTPQPRPPLSLPGIFRDVIRPLFTLLQCLTNMRRLVIALIISLRPGRLGLFALFIPRIDESGLFDPFRRSVAVCIVADILAVKAVKRQLGTNRIGMCVMGRDSLVSVSWKVCTRSALRVHDGSASRYTSGEADLQPHNVNISQVSCESNSRQARRRNIRYLQLSAVPLRSQPGCKVGPTRLVAELTYKQIFSNLEDVSWLIFPSHCDPAPSYRRTQSCGLTPNRTRIAVHQSQFLVRGHERETALSSTNTTINSLFACIASHIWRSFGSSKHVVEDGTTRTDRRQQHAQYPKQSIEPMVLLWRQVDLFR